MTCLSVAKSTTAFAQNTPLEASNARFHFGSLYVSPAFQLQELGVDTNVFNSADDPRSDFTVTAVPQAQALWTISKRVTMRGSGGASLIYYATYANQRSVNGTYDVRVDVNLTRFVPFVTDSLVNTRERPSYEFDIRPRHTLHTTGVGVTFKLHDKLDIDVLARQSQTRYDIAAIVDGFNVANNLDANGKGAGGEIRFHLTPYTAVTLHGEAARDRFIGDQTRNSNSYSIAPGVTFSPRALIAGSASVGYQHFEALTPGVPNYSGVIANAGLAYHLNGSTLLSGTIDRGLSYSYQPLGPYYIKNDITLTLRRQLVGRFDATAGTLRSVYDYHSVILPSVDLPIDDREDKTTNYSLDVGYRANRKTRIGFGVESWHRVSNQRTDRNYTGFRFRSTANVVF